MSLGVQGSLPGLFMIVCMMYHLYHRYNSFYQIHLFLKRYRRRRGFILRGPSYIVTAFFYQILRGHKNSEGLLNDYCDGLAYQHHPLFSTTDNSLEIMAYYDDVEVCNPLGSRSKKHKLGIVVMLLCMKYNYLLYVALFYYTLGNIPPKYRSSLRAIQLLAVLKSNDLQLYGPDKVIEPLMNAVKMLEQVLTLLFKANY